MNSSPEEFSGELTRAAPETIDPVTVGDLAEARSARTLDPGVRRLLGGERPYVNAYRRLHGRLSSTGDDLSALCISGGGIRSASFGLGVLQALASRDLLKRCDYLSTVSGGGYIGSALTWLLHAGKEEPRNGQPAFGLSPETFPFGTEDSSSDDVRRAGVRDRVDQLKMLSYMRGHGRYLTPGMGIGVASLLAVALRGAFLSLLVSLPLSAAAFAAIMTASFEATGDSEAGFALFRHLGLAALALLAAVTLVYALSTFLQKSQTDSSLKYRLRRLYDAFAGSLLVGAAAVTAVGYTAAVHVHVGTAALILGGAKAAFLFVVSSKWRPRIPVGPLAKAAAALVLYGVLVLSYHLALWGFDTVEGLTAWPAWSPFAVLALALACGRFVNLNYVSMHRYYRDRLMETFMPDLSSALHDATGPAWHANGARLSDMNRADAPAGPYHILNTNVNLTGAVSRLRRNRGGDSFTLSSAYCGSSETGWRRTDTFMRNGLTLPTAVAVSGAAAEPDAGVAGKGMTRDPSVAMLMTLLNLTLGFWIMHPLRAQRLARYPNHLNPGLLSFVTTAFSMRRTFLELGDGGHFENLGIYEMVRRRARLIVVSDAGCDPAYRFYDLLNAMQKVEVDFGARIRMSAAGKPVDPRTFFQSDSVDPPAVGHVTGEIEYADGSGGRLILIKASLVTGLGLQIAAFRDRYPAFPHESTGNQDFDEEHVETYRRLGYELTRRMIEAEGIDAFEIERRFEPAQGGALA